MNIQTGTELDTHVNLLGQPLHGFPTKNIITCVTKDDDQSFATTLLSSVAENNPHNFCWIDTCSYYPMLPVPVITLPPPVDTGKFIQTVMRPLLHSVKVVGITDLRGFKPPRKYHKWLNELKEVLIEEDGLCFMFTGKCYNPKRQREEPIAYKQLIAYSSIVLEEQDNGEIQCTMSSLGNTFPNVCLKPKNT